MSNTNKGCHACTIRERAELQIAHRLAIFQENLEKVTQDQCFLHTIQGYQLNLTSIPSQRDVPHPPVFNQEQQKAMSSEVQEMMAKRAIN